MKSFEEFLAETAMVDCSLWVRTHGEWPKDEIKSSWIFSIDPNAPIDDAHYHFTSKHDTFANAKKAASKYFYNSRRIFVLP